MSDLLAIVGPAQSDPELVDEIARLRPQRVTVLLEEGEEDWAVDDTPRGHARRDRLAQLLGLIGERTNAAVVGLAGDADQLLGWRFDRVIRSGVPLGV